MNNGRHFWLSRAKDAAARCNGNCNEGRACDCVPAVDPRYAEFEAAYNAEFDEPSRLDRDGRGLLRGLVLALVVVFGAVVVAHLLARLT